MKNKPNLSLELRAFVLGVLLLTLILCSRSLASSGTAALVLLTVAMAADLVLLFLVLRKLWRTKWKQKLKASMQRVLSKFARKLMALMEKWNLIRDRDKKVISGKTTVTFDFSQTETEKPPRRPPRWKKLKSDRERLGYLYRQVVEYNVKHGLSVYSSDTPIEVKAKKENEPVEDRVYDLYIENRYRESTVTDGETLEELKKEIGKM